MEIVQEKDVKQRNPIVKNQQAPSLATLADPSLQTNTTTVTEITPCSSSSLLLPYSVFFPNSFPQIYLLSV